ncbi:uncharacterized protein FOMMEDRAFT_16814 [Fomitiporia mediterranea MF3/22]|uniref:uncharacterized protein n=1 Tax=Fomitiporia mediterranea (strain MF3/22) TaxID=694068 RepID=UPI0004408CCC|nr:uncharacterized protein FOMMEDRAFT_16814 [Fomitiporia mediterranea MF3/22]EJD08460.1 hypothetical protein FOMMEDRAFT_16814 [Fomitiporia mediterranea MF3/22]
MHSSTSPEPTIYADISAYRMSNVVETGVQRKGDRPCNNCVRSGSRLFPLRIWLFPTPERQHPLFHQNA